MQNAVTDHFLSEQLLPIGFEHQYDMENITSSRGRWNWIIKIESNFNA